MHSVDSPTTVRYNSLPLSSIPENLQWYFAYGSNMSLEQLIVRVGPPKRRVAASLLHYRFLINKNGTKPEVGYANVEPRHGAIVFGVALLLTRSQVDRMDLFEGGYCRVLEDIFLYQNNNFETPVEKVTAVVYVASGNAVSDQVAPSAQYMGRILEGEDLLPAWYAQELREIPHCACISPRQEQRDAKLL